MYSKETISGYHTAILLSLKDCTTVYGDDRGVTDDEPIQDTCEIHGLNCRG